MLNKPLNSPYFDRKGFSTFHDPSGTYQPLGQQNVAAGLPQNPMNIGEAQKADPEEPSEGPDVRNQLKRFGGNINEDNPAADR